MFWYNCSGYPDFLFVVASEDFARVVYGLFTHALQKL